MKLGTNIREVNLILKGENCSFPGLMNERASLTASDLGDHGAGGEAAEEPQADQRQ